MSEAVVADFVARMSTPDVSADGPVSGRVLLSRQQLVCATGDARTVIPLASVFDVAIGAVPDELQSFFDDSITVAYDVGGTRATASIGGDTEDITQFTTVLFKALLADVTVMVRHPAAVGGRVVESTPQPAKVSLQSGSLGFIGSEDAVTVSLSTVVDYERTTRTVNGDRRPAVVFRHGAADRTITTVVTVPDASALSVLGRYLKREYEDVRADAEALDLPPEALEILVSIHAAGGTASIADIVTGDAAQTSLLLDSLRADGLVVDGETGPTLTRFGRLAVMTHLEAVNA